MPPRTLCSLPLEAALSALRAAGRALMETPQFQRLAEVDRPRILLFIDGISCEALAGDTLLTALLTNGQRLRSSEFGDGPRAGFCLMGACQDCWVTLEDGARLRACTSFVAEGMRIVTRGTNG